MLRSIDLERIKAHGLKPEAFEPQDPDKLRQQNEELREQIADLTDLVAILAEVIADD